MLLLCIKNATEAFYVDDNAKAPNPEKGLIVGEYYNTIHEREFEDGLYYWLEGFPHYECFHHSLFAMPSDLDETELVTEEFEEKYCVPVNS
jgi:hypothetical protein